MAKELRINGQVDLRINGEDFINFPTILFDHVETIYGGLRWRLRTDVDDWSKLADILDSVESQRAPFQYKFLFVGGREDVGTLDESVEDWYTGVILKTYSDLHTTYIRGEIIGSDLSLKMKGNAKTRAWKTSVDQIARIIAREHGITEVDVEAAKEKNNPVYWQYGENDWSFLDRIRTKLVSSSGIARGDYNMWMSKGRVLHIRPPGSPGRSVNKWELAAGSDGRVKRFRIVQRKRALQLFGGLSIRGIAVDPLTKQAITFDHNFQTASEKPRMGSRTTLDDDAPSPAMVMRSIAENEADLQRDVISEYGRRYRKMYMAVAEISPEITGYNVGDIITMTLRGPEGTEHPYVSGNYLIEGRRVKISTGNIRIWLLLSRFGARTGREGIPGAPFDLPATTAITGRFRLGRFLA